MWCFDLETRLYICCYISRIIMNITVEMRIFLVCFKKRKKKKTVQEMKCIA